MSECQPVLDRYQRPLNDLRISVIDRCNFRCPYCMPLSEYGIKHQFLQRQQWLSFDEIYRVASAFASLGVNKLRMTGGEPLLRPGLSELVQQLKSISAVDEIAMSTNAVLLSRHAEALRQAGLDRVTVSLDAIDTQNFLRMSGGQGELGEVLDGIQAAHEVGFPAVKVNVVIIKGQNEDQIIPLLEYFRPLGVTVRFIEYMDVGNQNGWSLAEVVPWRNIHAQINACWPLEPIAARYEGEVAKRFRFQDGSGEVGFITSITQPFCHACSRARITADGKLYTCLFASDGYDLKMPLRAGMSDSELMNVIASRWRKRIDRYSEVRLQQQRNGKRIEMYQVGG